ncbi:hypothetical protein JL721_8297 [Aureococcus anophagefferens]|nr:hypothetical protein JL721_8297 [Aureococcus anophagefferens]
MLLAIGALVAAARADAPRRAPIALTLRAPRRVLMHRKHPEKRAACEPGSCTCKACCAANMTAHACRACVVAEGCVKLDDAPSRPGRPADPNPAARPRACWPADGSAFDGGEAYWLNIADVEAERFNQPQFIHIAKTGGSAMRRHPYERFLSLFRHEVHYLRSGASLWHGAGPASPILFFLRAGTRPVSLDYFSTDAERQAAGPDFERGSCSTRRRSRPGARAASLRSRVRRASPPRRADRKLARLELLTNETTAKQRRRIRRMCNVSDDALRSVLWR